MKITSKGQVTIPLEFRMRYGLLPETDVEFIPGKQSLRLMKSPRNNLRGTRIVERMRGRGDGRLSTDEIMRLTRGED